MEHARIRDEKARLRTAFLNKRLSLSQADHRALSGSLCRQLVDLVTVRRVRRIHVFWPLHEKREVDVCPAILKWLADELEVWLPVVHEDRLHGGQLHDPNHLKPGPYGTEQPEYDPAFKWDQMDLIIVPALAADHDGYRLGYGGGYYDRTLQDVRVPTVCPIFPWELTRHLPHEPHDVQMTHIITP